MLQKILKQTLILKFFNRHQLKSLLRREALAIKADKIGINKADNLDSSKGLACTLTPRSLIARSNLKCFKKPIAQSPAGKENISVRQVDETDIFKSHEVLSICSQVSSVSKLPMTYSSNLDSIDCRDSCDDGERK